MPTQTIFIHWPLLSMGAYKAAMDSRAGACSSLIMLNSSNGFGSKTIRPLPAPSTVMVDTVIATSKTNNRMTNLYFFKGSPFPNVGNKKTPSDWKGSLVFEIESCLGYTQTGSCHSRYFMDIRVPVKIFMDLQMC